ncbi:hypothetical protein [uncultured Sphingomonas sp.]|nr:hypothetical protein [uncultured Sphingomonas sp.]
MIDPEEQSAHDEDATNVGQSAEEPAEGSDDAPAGGEGSPDA